MVSHFLTADFPSDSPSIIVRSFVCRHTAPLCSYERDSHCAVLRRKIYFYCTPRHPRAFSFPPPPKENFDFSHQFRFRVFHARQRTVRCYSSRLFTFLLASSLCAQLSLYDTNTHDGKSESTLERSTNLCFIVEHVNGKLK